MSWFRYLPSDASPNQVTQDENYVYPLLRRIIEVPDLKQTIPAGSWLFVEVKDLKIDDYIDDSLLTQKEQNSYLVVYESNAADDYVFVPVKSHIISNRLFFKTAEQHLVNTKPEKQYSLYYKTDDLKSIKKVQNGQFEDYISCPSNEAEFITTPDEVDQTFFNVYPNTNEIYSFSFTNINVDWKNGLSLSPGAKVIGTFTGPFFELYCDKAPDYGKFRIKLIALSNESTPTSVVEQDWITIDLFDSTTKLNQLVYSKNNLYYKNYIFEIVSNFEKNDLSTNGQIKIDHYSFGYDAKCNVKAEEINPYLSIRKIFGGNVNG